MLACYQILVGLLFWASFPFLLLFVFLTGKHRAGLSERLGLSRPLRKSSGKQRRVWMHAASIGEVRAAGVLIAYLKERMGTWDFLVTTMTVHGRDFAARHLGPDIQCRLAPLDVPLVAGRVVDGTDPDLYVCLETELWPILVSRLHRKQVPIVLVNGRLSDKSFAGYLRFAFFFRQVLRAFSAIGVISEDDRKRFITLGADPDMVTVTGNIKHDFILPADRDGVIRTWREILRLDPGVDAIVCGSTHEPEEELLLHGYREMIASCSQVWLIAPRHLDRLDAIGAMLDAAGVGYDLLSRLKQGSSRRESLVVVDTFGDLSELFSIASFVFIGGSLARCGGHNVMEAAMWNKVVFFGPHISDFKEAAELLERCGGGYRVDSVEDMTARMELLLGDRLRLDQLQRRAGEAAALQQGAAARQAELILKSAAIGDQDGPRSFRKKC